MTLENKVVQLCVAGNQAEFQGRLDEACRLYREAWDLAGDDFEACVAAHYVARCQATAEDSLHWNEIALRRAEADAGERVEPFFGSLYLNLGRDHERLGNAELAEQYYALAAARGMPHRMS